jgi:FAD/FMN-containing dehydrogenase
VWEARRDLSYALRRLAPRKINHDVVVPRGRVPELYGLIDGIRARHRLVIAAFGHAGDGNIHVNLMVENPDDPSTAERMEQALDKLFTGVLAMGGVITGEHGIGLAKKRWWPKAVDAGSHELHRRVKRALDPHDLLNPGKFLES